MRTQSINKYAATKAISLIIKIAKKKGLKKLTAGFYDKNFGSKRVLLKNNFKKEAHFKSQIQYKSKRHDKIVFGKIIK